MYCTNLHTIQELQVETEAVAQDLTGDMLHDIVETLLVHLR